MTKEFKVNGLSATKIRKLTVHTKDDSPNWCGRVFKNIRPYSNRFVHAILYCEFITNKKLANMVIFKLENKFCYRHFDLNEVNALFDSIIAKVPIKSEDVFLRNRFDNAIIDYEQRNKSHPTKVILKKNLRKFPEADSFHAAYELILCIEYSKSFWSDLFYDPKKTHLSSNEIKDLVSAYLRVDTRITSEMQLKNILDDLPEAFYEVYSFARETNNVDEFITKCFTETTHLEGIYYNLTEWYKKTKRSQPLAEAISTDAVKYADPDNMQYFQEVYTLVKKIECKAEQIKKLLSGDRLFSEEIGCIVSRNLNVITHAENIDELIPVLDDFPKAFNSAYSLAKEKGLEKEFFSECFLNTPCLEAKYRAITQWLAKHVIDYDQEIAFTGDLSKESIIKIIGDCIPKFQEIKARQFFNEKILPLYRMEFLFGDAGKNGFEIPNFGSKKWEKEKFHIYKDAEFLNEYFLKEDFFQYLIENLKLSDTPQNDADGNPITASSLEAYYNQTLELTYMDDVFEL